MWGKVIKFNTQALNAFLETPVIIPKGEQLTTYCQYLHIYPNHQAIATKLCTSGNQFTLNIEGALWKILHKDLTVLAQTWNVLNYFNLAFTSYTFDLNVNRAHG